MASIVITLKDEDDGSVSVVLEAEPGVQVEDVDDLTGAQHYGVLALSAIANSGEIEYARVNDVDVSDRFDNPTLL